MIKNYTYLIEGKDGNGYAFQVYGEITCEYGEVWTVANKDCIRKLLLGESDCSYICPVNIERVMINQREVI